MNRSKRVNESMSRSARSQGNINTNDNGFGFLKTKNPDGGFLLRDSFIPKFKSMNDSYIKNV